MKKFVQNLSDYNFTGSVNEEESDDDEVELLVESDEPAAPLSGGGGGGGVENFTRLIIFTDEKNPTSPLPPPVR